MLSADQYRLLDFGNHCKREWFGGVVTLRQTPSAPGPWGGDDPPADLEFILQGESGIWQGDPPRDWILPIGQTPVRLSLQPRPSGQLGVFPEQAENWRWIDEHGPAWQGMQAINLFAYTGATTLMLAHSGAAVTHVDAAKSVVAWARRNAKLSHLQTAPIRWIVEDASKYLAREIKRKRQYELLIADPPSFGRGPGGQTWKLQRDLPTLLNQMAQLASPQLRCILITCHTPGIGPRELASQCTQAFGGCPAFKRGTWDSFELRIPVHGTNRQLSSGACFRWSSDQAMAWRSD